MRTSLLSGVVVVAVMAGTVLVISALTDSFAALVVGVFVAALVGPALAGKVARRDTAPQRGPRHISPR